MNIKLVQKNLSNFTNYATSDGTASFHVIVKDTELPDTKVTGAFDGKNLKLANGGKTGSTSAKFFFIGSDNFGVSSFECSLDSGSWNSCTSPVTYSGPLQKSITHVFKVRAVDAAGNKDSTPDTWTWSIQNTSKLK
jgi:hypothetical protein